MPGNRFSVVLIEEGLGNFGSAVYYTRQALQSGVDLQLFEGAKCYGDHPDKQQEVLRPERSVRDIVGHFENVTIQNGKTGQALMVGDLVLLEGEQNNWALDLVSTAVALSGKLPKEFVGFSINAAGNAEKNSIAQFMKSETIPQSAMPKLLVAESKGIEFIEVCTLLTEAVSCDLVTEAGAKGRALKLLEGERIKMAIPAKKKVTEGNPPPAAPAKKPAAGAAPAADGSDGDEGNAGSADADQDKELIASMLQKYLGTTEPSDEECQAMHEAHEAAKEMGLEGEDAQAAAGYSMKMARHQARKQAAKKEAEESEVEEAGDAGAPATGDDAGAAGAVAGGKPPVAQKKESETVMKLLGRVARLEKEKADSETQNKISKAMDKALKESGLPMSATKKFREHAGKVSSEKELTEKLNLFKEAYSFSGEAEGGAFINPEKTGTATGGMSFADCVKE